MSDITLDRAIEQQIELGHRDPHEMYDILMRSLGDELFEIAKPWLADFISEMTRQRVNSKRRHAVAKINPRTLADPKVKLQTLWVPGEGKIIYKRIADMTADDFDARADYMEAMVKGITRHMQWCRNVASDIRAAGVKTAGKLTSLPALPEVDE